MAAARAKVLGRGPEGVGFGGRPVNVKNDRGEIIDLLKTYSLQSRSNALSAMFSAISATSMVLLFLLSMVR